MKKKKKNSKKYARRKIPNYDVINLYVKHSASGAEAQFFKLSNTSKFGIKAYDDLTDAEQAYKDQKFLSSKGLAPNVGNLLVIKQFPYKGAGAKQVLFGYETQIAKKVKRGSKNYTWITQSYRLKQKLNKYGFDFDFRPDNCGIIRNKLVLVDCGAASRGSFEKIELS